MPLNEMDKAWIEETIQGVVEAADTYLKDENEFNLEELEREHETLIEVLHILRQDIYDDANYPEYKIKLMVPFNILELVRKRKDER